MQRSNPWVVSLFAVAAGFVPVCQAVAGADVPMTKEIKAMVDFQCHGAKTLKKAEANHAYMARSYTDQHPVIQCLNKKIVELKAAGK
jgi:hypothetical protein